MSSTYSQLAKKRVSLETLLRQGRSMMDRGNTSMEAAESYETLATALVADDLTRPVTDGEMAPDEILENAYQALAAKQPEIEQQLEGARDAEELIGSTVSLADDEVADEVIGMIEDVEGAEALLDVTKEINNNPELKDSVSVESLQRHVVRQLQRMDIPEKHYKHLKRKGIGFESIELTLETIAQAGNNVLDQVSSSLSSTGLESADLGKVSSKGLMAAALLKERSKRRGA